MNIWVPYYLELIKCPAGRELVARCVCLFCVFIKRKRTVVYVYEYGKQYGNILTQYSVSGLSFRLFIFLTMSLLTTVPNLF